MLLIAAGLLLFTAGLAVALLVIRWLRIHAHRLGLIDAPGGRRDHERATPLIGGLAIMAAVAIPSFGGLLLALGNFSSTAWWPADLSVHGPGLLLRSKELFAILAGSALMMGLGYLDDRHGLSPWLRLMIEAGAAALLFLAGVGATAFLPSPWMHAALTIGFVTFLTNAVNFIDNMNGLSVGTVALGAAALLAIAAATGQLFLAAILSCLLGGCVAFLPQNFPRATVFLGDAGSLSLGFLMAGLTLAFTFEEGSSIARPLIVPGLVLFIPLVDGFTVIVTRIARGIHPFTAGHDHLSHRLVRLGLDRRQAVGTLWSVQAAAALAATLVSGTPMSFVAVVFGTAIGALVLVTSVLRR